MAEKVLVTGNLGYNGCIVTKVLRENGYETVGLDSGYYSGALYDDPACSPDVQIMKDVRDVSAPDLSGIDHVVHLAALSNDSMGELDPRLTEAINRDSTVRLAELAKRGGASKFVFASSCSVYGIQDPKEAATESSRLEPLTAYARAKVESEAALEKMHGGGFSVVLMRNATMHGPSPKLRLDLVVNNLVATARVHGKVKILSDGTPWRPIVSVLDFARAVGLFLRKDAEHVVYNVGFDAENYQVRDIGQAVHEVTGAPIEINLNKTPDERSYRVDFGRFDGEFGMEMSMGLRDSIKALIDAYERGGLSEEDLSGDKFFRVRTIKGLMSSGRLDRNLKWV